MLRVTGADVVDRGGPEARKEGSGQVGACLLCRVARLSALELASKAQGLHWTVPRKLCVILDKSFLLCASVRGPLKLFSL